MSDSATSHRFTNHLSSEKSPYLLQHAHNPVDWHPWGQEALDTARQQDKPIFLSVGYSACHWCHVMERESFENDATAALLNDHFVCVKVDREERPDIDEIYMTAVQMLTGHGGWPMSVFLTPDGRPFFGGTYFPPQTVRGRVGFPSLITQLGEAWHSRREEVERVATEIADDLEKATRQRPIAADSGTLNPTALLSSAVNDLNERFDVASGGFGGSPKFPPHHALRLLTDAARRGDAEAPRLLITTLDKMALGGIYDHVGGGFHRYATDAAWLLPHFEKMLYDNALLARVYADAFEVTGRKAYARVARETCDWVLCDMTDASGGFHAALDADSEGEEGKYYVWTPSEITDILGKAAADALALRYHIKTGGNFRDEATGHQSESNIPYLAVGESDVDLPDELDTALAASREHLRSFRDNRVPPGKDDKVITAWNGLMIGALAFVGATLGEVRYIDAARRAARFTLTTLRPGGQLVRRYAKGEAGLPAFLDDYAYLADGLMDLYDATGETEWRDAASDLADTLIRDFWDAEDGGFFYTRNNHENLIARSKDLFDGALPSANGVAARALIRLGVSDAPNADRYAETARALLIAYRGVLERAPSGTHSLISATLEAFPESNTPTIDHAPVRLAAAVSSLVLTPGESGAAEFVLHVGNSYHVEVRPSATVTDQPPQRNKTTATIATDAPAAIGPVVFPASTPYQVGGEDLNAYVGEVTFTVPVQTTAEAEPGTYQVTLTVRCEPCSEMECLPPVEVTATATVSIR